MSNFDDGVVVQWVGHHVIGRAFSLVEVVLAVLGILNVILSLLVRSSTEVQERKWDTFQVEGVAVEVGRVRQVIAFHCQLST